jgi:thiol-disulfide isomerase/thioredoxin
MIRILICQFFFLCFIPSAFTQVELYIHQPKCTNKTVVHIANNPQYEPQEVDENTQLFIVDSPVEPKEMVFIIDSVGLMIEKFWIESSSKRIDFYLYNCRQYIFYVENPNDLTRAARADDYYVKYLREKSRNDEEFMELYLEHEIDYIQNNPNSFLSLDAFEKINISHEKKEELLKTLGEENKKYPLFAKLLNKYSTIVNLDSLNLSLKYGNINEDTLHFSTFKDKPVVFVFWMSGCKWSTKLLPNITALDKKNRDVAFVYYSLDENLEQWRKASEKFDIPKKYNISELNGYLGKLPTTLGVDKTPFFVVADTNQKIVLITFGDELYLVEKEIQNFH